MNTGEAEKEAINLEAQFEGLAEKENLQFGNDDKAENLCKCYWQIETFSFYIPKSIASNY